MTGISQSIKAIDPAVGVTAWPHLQELGPKAVILEVRPRFPTPHRSLHTYSTIASLSVCDPLSGFVRVVSSSSFLVCSLVDIHFLSRCSNWGVWYSSDRCLSNIRLYISSASTYFPFHDQTTGKSNGTSSLICPTPICPIISQVGNLRLHPTLQ